MKKRNGAAAIEFALVAPVFILLVFGLIEMGRVMMIKQALTNAAREGCRTAGLASNINASSVETTVRDYLQAALGSTTANSTKVRVTVPSTLAGVASETDLTVAVELDYADATWLQTSFLGINPTIAAQTRRKRE